MSATAQREQAIQAATVDFQRAVRLAREVAEPWFRCQALASVARHAPDGEVAGLAMEAVKAARAGNDRYQQVAACAWPVRALAERNETRRATQIVAEVLPLAGEITHPVSRLEALFLFWQAAYPLAGTVRHTVLGALVAACLAASSWRAGRTMRDVALIMAAEDRRRAEQLVASMPACRYKRQAERALAAGETHSPRTFF